MGALRRRPLLRRQVGKGAGFLSRPRFFAKI